MDLSHFIWASRPLGVGLVPLVVSLVSILPVKGLGLRFDTCVVLVVSVSLCNNFKS